MYGSLLRVESLMRDQFFLLHSRSLIFSSLSLSLSLSFTLIYFWWFWNHMNIVFFFLSVNIVYLICIFWLKKHLSYFLSTQLYIVKNVHLYSMDIAQYRDEPLQIPRTNTFFNKIKFAEVMHLCAVILWKLF